MGGVEEEEEYCRRSEDALLFQEVTAVDAVGWLPVQSGL